MELRREPFRIFFPLGMAVGLAGVAPWPLYAHGDLTQYPGLLHALSMTQGFLLLPAFGFLGTMLPRRSQTAPLSALELAAAGAGPLLVPLLFSVGTGVVTLIGVATGAGDISRGNRIARIASVIAFLATQSIGMLLAIVPSWWVHLFSSDPSVLVAGSTYFRVVAPSYGFFGVGLMLYFASQGRSKMLWPFVAGTLRLVITVAGAAWLASRGASLALVVAPVAAGYVLFGLINAVGFFSNARRLVARQATASPLSITG